MQLGKRIRFGLGMITMALGLALMLAAIYVSDESSLTGSTKTIAATASALSGGVITFVISRRLLTVEK
jgi:hypothetical protein